jgi:Thiamine pyrophosphate-requiring enzymes [acetolactate synthase, pyruvate dehydrogenase (cytochrome), glyoxylate carboligase, phosphonopyruvate decarboxylase]
MRISDSILKYLEMNKVKYVFGIPSGTISATVDSFNESNIQYIITKNEAGAAYSATKYASTSKELGVCLIAGGVGVANAINGIAEACNSKAPVLFISGYVKTWQKNKRAMQDLDTEELVRPITKYSKTIFNSNDVLNEIKKAIEISKTPPYGPTALSIPIDIQLAEFNDYFPKPSNPLLHIDDTSDFTKIVEEINKFDKGILMVGNGCRGLSKRIMELSQKIGWRIITTPNAKGIIPADFIFNLGTYGFASSDLALKYINEGYGDCILALGTSLGESSTKNYDMSLFNNRKLIHIDWDEKELNRNFPEYISVKADLSNVLEYLIDNVNNKDYLIPIREPYNKPYVQCHTGLSIRRFLEELIHIIPRNTFYVSDMGETMNYLYKYLELPDESDFESNLNYASMGTGIGGAIGIKLAHPNMNVAVFVGDGAFWMNGFEVLTAKEYNIPIIYFVVNNALLSYVDRGHKFLFGRTFQGLSQERVSISAVAASLNIETITITEIDDMSKLNGKLENRISPLIVELVTDSSEPIPIDRFNSLNSKNS